MSDAGHLNEPGVRSDAQHRLAELAAKQNGVFSLVHCADFGLGVRAVQKRAAAGQLFRVYQTVYSLAPPELLSRDGRFMAAVLACGPGAVLSHRSAAALHELRPTERSGIDVTVRGRSTRRHQGIDVHRSTTLTSADVTLVRNIPTTTIARTLLDLAGVVRRRPLERAMDQAEILEVLDHRALEDQIKRNDKTPAAHKLRTLLDEHTAGSTPTWTELETAFLMLCRAAALPQPEVNAWVVLDDGEPAIRPDFVWRAQRLAIETDSRKYHRTRQAFEIDRRRDQRLTLGGWRIVRVTWRQIKSEPAMIARLIAGLLSQPYRLGPTTL